MDRKNKLAIKLYFQLGASTSQVLCGPPSLQRAKLSQLEEQKYRKGRSAEIKKKS